MIHWKLNLIGDKKSFPIKQIQVKDTDCCSNYERRRGIQVVLTNELVISNKSFVSTPGPSFPYIGSSTQQKARKPSINVSDPTLLCHKTF